jgi:hypothetical protein
VYRCGRVQEIAIPRREPSAIVASKKPTMSYDIYCFRPSSNSPSLREARAVVESEEVGDKPDDASSLETKRKTVNALTDYNPRLEPFQFDYTRLARDLKISEEQARRQFAHIELNPPEGDPAIQLTVFSDHVSINFPYWYTGPEADTLFDQLEDYLRVIREAVGYFAFDPQTDRVFDPAKESLGSHDSYDRIAEDLPAIIARELKKEQKPWWKFW